MSNERPYPIFKPADYLGPEYAGEISVECSACPDGFTEAHKSTDDAFWAWDNHASVEHVGFQVKSFDQAFEVVLNRVGPYGDLASCVAAVNAHIRETTAHVSVNADPVFGLRLLVDACERMQSAAAMIQAEAEGLLSEMPQPLDKTTAGV